ncbi:MAG: transcriptional regulator NrdR [Dehalococcoidia bacterium]|nr:transcriptional regulator NrdR [Dehalococcoidia bacterium]
MKCPFCGHDTNKVIDSRAGDAGVRRRRKCEACGERFTTYEQVQRAVVMVVKKDGRREEFNREKLLTGLRISARKRPLPSGAVEAIVEDIEQRLMGSNRSEVPSRVIGEMAITRLKGLDPIAYIRFASVYHQFVSLDEMLEELNRIANSGPFALSVEQAKLFEDDLDALVRGEPAPAPPTQDETAEALEALEREPVSLDAHRTATIR